MLGLGWKFIYISSEVTPNRKEVNMMLSTLSPVRKWKRCLPWRQLYDYTSTWGMLKTTEDHRRPQWSRCAPWKETKRKRNKGSSNICIRYAQQPCSQGVSAVWADLCRGVPISNSLQPVSQAFPFLGYATLLPWKLQRVLQSLVKPVVSLYL